jgi:hypothetical protein
MIALRAANERHPIISVDKEKLFSLVKSNMACHFNKPLSSELIQSVSQQIVDSISFVIKKDCA